MTRKQINAHFAQDLSIIRVLRDDQTPAQLPLGMTALIQYGKSFWPSFSILIIFNEDQP